MSGSPTPTPPSPAPGTLPLLSSLLSELRQCLLQHSPSLPLLHFHPRYHITTHSHSLLPGQPLHLTLATLPRLARILQIVQIAIDNLQQGRTVTKRNLYYRLGSWYGGYVGVEEDVRWLCMNLGYMGGRRVGRGQLGIVASSRGIVYGRATIVMDGKEVKTESQSQLTTLTTCKQASIHSHAPIVIIIQKQSIFFELSSLLRSHNLHNYLLLTAKGYPDLTTRQLAHQLSQQPTVQQIYYLGDYDVFGFDIFMNYAMGDWWCEGVLERVHLLDLGGQAARAVVDWEGLRADMQVWGPGDRRKGEEIRGKWFGEIGKIEYSELPIHIKIREIYSYFNQFTKQGLKCELQSFSSHAKHPLWVLQLLA